MKTTNPKLMAILLLGFGTLAVHAQVATEAWVQRYNGPANRNDYASAVAVDSSGNVVVTGSSANASDFLDYLTIKYSSSGVPLWTNRYNGPAGFLNDDTAQAMAVDGSGNVFVTGISANTNNPFGYATIKYSSSGTPLWTNRYDGLNGSGALAGAIVVDVSGNAIVTGYSLGNGSGEDYVTIKYSSAGMALWTNRYNGTANSTDFPTALAVHTNGNVFVTGQSFGSGTQFDYATIAYSSTGVSLWTHRYNGSGNSFDGAIAVAVSVDGQVVVTGASTGSETSSDYATIAYSITGVPLWTNRYAGLESNPESANALAIDTIGNVFVTGSSLDNDSYDYLTIAYSAGGVPLWTNYYDGPGNGEDLPVAAGIDSSGNVIVTGHSLGGDTGFDYATIAYSISGVPLWTNRYNGTGDYNDFARSLAIASDGVVVVGDSSTGDYDDFATVKYTPPPGFNLIKPHLLASGDLRLSYEGIAGMNYALERTFNLTSPINWVALVTNSAGLDGVLVLTNSPVPGTNNFWRIRSVP